MEQLSLFRNWLNQTTSYTNPTKNNIVSRVKRANIILPIIEDPVYLYNLSLSPEFQNLTVSVKSQIRRAVKIYFEFLKSEGDGYEEH